MNARNSGQEVRLAPSTEEAVRAAFAQQAEWCIRLASPFTALLCDLLAKDLDRSTLVGRRALDWPGPPGSTADALPLRLVGGLHALVRRGRLPELAPCYPPNPLPGADRLRPILNAALRDADTELAEWLDRTPQTNEVGRSAALMAGLLVIASRHPAKPFALHEVGASAGLNLMLDRYRYRLGGTEAGDPASPLLLAPEWEGPSPPEASVRVARRSGVDLHPLDVTDADDGERLIAYVWPDQAARLADLETALAVARTDPPRIERGDAADWTEANLAPAAGTVQVLTHTIAFHYFPPETRVRIEAHMARAGAAASLDSPMAWLRYEFHPAHETGPALRLAIWPDGTDEILAVGHPHVRQLRWLSAGAGVVTE